MSISERNIYTQSKPWDSSLHEKVFDAQAIRASILVIYISTTKYMYL